MINFRKKSAYPVKQRGVAALAVGLILLFAATIITIFAAKVGVQEQRISGNEYRAKLAFETAQAGLDYGQIYLQQNLRNIYNSTIWTWTPCSSFSRPSSPPPWKNDRLDQFCQDSGGVWRNNLLLASIPNDQTTQSATNASVAYRVFYLANAPGGTIPDTNNSAFNITVLSEGASDIPSNLNRSVDNGAGYGFMKVDIVTKSPLINPPKAPLTAVGTINVGTGTFSIVTNPNGAAQGAPISVWSGGDVNLAGPGTAQTCNVHEFYAQGSGNPIIYRPDGTTTSFTFGLAGTTSSVNDNDIVLCDDCDCSQVSANNQITGARGNAEGMDILDRDYNSSGVNPDVSYFPTDCTSGSNPCSDGSCPTSNDRSPTGNSDLNLLFRYFFGVCKNNELSEQVIKSQSQVIDDCDDLDANSGLSSNTGGLYWVTSACSINRNVGSPTNPVLLIVPGSVSLGGNSNFYGMIYSFGSMSSGGNVNFYGAMVTESLFNQNGTFDLIYNEKVLRNLARNLRTPHKVPGSWADYAQE